MASALVGGVASLGSALLGNRQANKAQDAQERARQEALAYEREQQDARRRDYEQRQQAYYNAVRQWYQRYGERGINRFGVPMGIEIVPEGRARRGRLLPREQPGGQQPGAVPRGSVRAEGMPAGGPAPPGTPTGPAALSQLAGSLRRSGVPGGPPPGAGTAAMPGQGRPRGVSLGEMIRGRAY